MSFNNCIVLCGKRKTWYFSYWDTDGFSVLAGPGGKGQRAACLVPNHYISW